MTLGALITLLLLTPVLVCNAVQDPTARIIVIVASNIVIQTVLSGIAKSRTIELFVAGATYEDFHQSATDEKLAYCLLMQILDPVDCISLWHTDELGHEYLG